MIIISLLLLQLRFPEIPRPREILSCLTDLAANPLCSGRVFCSLNLELQLIGMLYEAILLARRKIIGVVVVYEAKKERS